MNVPDQLLIFLFPLFSSLPTATIVIQMWPVTSTTVYEWVNNAHLTAEDKVDLKRYEIPKYLLFAVFIVFTILIGQLLNVGNSSSSSN